MPTLPWTTPNAPQPDAQILVMASRLEVSSLRHSPRFFLKSLSAWRQVRRAPGAVGASLIAQPLKGVFWTLSAWEDRKALYTYAKTEPHHSIMTSLRAVTKTSTFVFWEVAAEQLPIDWADAKNRIAEQQRLDAAAE
ncbi:MULTISPECIES: DUF3291 domain-containing protein [unclassified Kitasatospora]|uniref:DUF3291 domain-containing protein n=1 Tax=unclassified Kitasatospora TaxID=2633591 RepID=UPI000709FE75|nr:MULTISPECIES: DUF3291 domain-containing protein [unclassified Kitasatospora]KQV19137.1 hypothetical protein ASC99_23475 [Kitasatospora sp. Root107]KRB75612.1 hypothetical protein ASE03_16900 [Kitasatospora sp. Root187]